MRHLAAPIIVGAALIAVPASARAQTAPAPVPTAESASPSDPLAKTVRVRDRTDVLTEQQIAETHLSNGLEVVQRLRAQWMFNRGGNIPDPDGSVEVQVWVDGADQGGLDVLARLDVERISMMRYVDPIRARTTYGPGNGRGVITVTLR